MTFFWILILDYLTWFLNTVCFVLLLCWFSIILSLFNCHIWEIAVKIEIVAFLEYLVFIYIFIYILYIYYILYSRTIWEKPRYYEIAFIWFFCANCLQREHSSKSREKHKGNNERSKVEQFTGWCKANLSFFGFRGNCRLLGEIADRKPSHKIYFLIWINFQLIINFNCYHLSLLQYSNRNFLST